MNQSGVVWIDTLFNLCVIFLIALGQLVGVSYTGINVWIFCVIWPAFTLLLMGIVIWQWRVIRRLNVSIRSLCEN